MYEKEQFVANLERSEIDTLLAGSNLVSLGWSALVRIARRRRAARSTSAAAPPTTSRRRSVCSVPRRAD